MNYLPHLLAILIGASLTVQIGMNATVRGALGRLATVVNFAIGLVALVVLAALVVDHYGAIGFPQNPVTAGRVIGVALLVVGVVLIMRR